MMGLKEKRWDGVGWAGSGLHGFGTLFEQGSLSSAAQHFNDQYIIFTTCVLERTALKRNERKGKGRRGCLFPKRYENGTMK